MSTEYRRNIPSVAHVEAATRLGLLWQAENNDEDYWRFGIVRGEVHSVYDNRLNTVTTGRLSPCFDEERIASFRPMRPDGTPVDWEVLDQEVARVGQQGQPQGFRADLWRRICSWITSTYLPNIASIAYINDFGIVGQTRGYSWDTLGLDTQTDEADRQALIARWTVYQELKPLYDLVDGAQGEAAMPRDVEAEWDRQTLGSGYNYETDGDWVFGRDSLGVFARSADFDVWRAGSSGSQVPLRNFAAVLDAVAERRVAEQMRGQTQAPTVTSTPPEQHRHDWIYDGLGGGHNGQYYHNCACGERDWFAEPMSAPAPREAVVRPAAAQPEPRRFADVRPDRHGWRWWRVWTYHDEDVIDGSFLIRNDRPMAWQEVRTVIPTDEQGNPVSWDSIGPMDPTEIRLTSAPGAPDRHGTRWSAPEEVPSPQGWATSGRPCSTSAETAAATRWELTPEFQRALHADTIRYCEQQIIQAIIGVDTGHVTTRNSNGVDSPLPRFTADELDDVDHSKTTKLDEVTLRRGKLPTVEQIAKYREVRAKRSGGTVADALKESRIDCEVAQYVLERWAGGLGDADTVLLLRAVGCIVPLKDAPQHSIRAFDPKQGEVDRRSQDFLRTHNATLDTSEKPSPTVQRERQEAEERRQRLAELRQRLAAERAAQTREMAKESEASRFDLIEPDPQADPAASVRAWEARQAAAKVRPAAAPPRIAKPAAAPRRPAIEVVDAEADGLSRSEAFAALFGRALNGGC